MTDKEKRFLEAFNRFCAKEYGNAPVYSLEPKMDVAYTTACEFNEDEPHECHEILVSIDTVNWKWLNYIDGELVLEQPRDIDTLIEELGRCEFDDVIADCLEAGFDKYRED